MRQAGRKDVNLAPCLFSYQVYCRVTDFIVQLPTLLFVVKCGRKIISVAKCFVNY